MTFAKVFLSSAVVLFGAIGALALSKGKNVEKPNKTTSIETPKEVIEIDLSTLKVPVVYQDDVSFVPQEEPKEIAAVFHKEVHDVAVPEVDRIDQLFIRNSPCPIVKTISYKNKVSWKFGKPAWLTDYASHYNTSIDFLARSINGGPNYTPGVIQNGQECTIYSPDVHFYFYMVIDIARAKLFLYYVIPDQEKCVLLKTYNVGLGRKDTTQKSGCLTPLGKYLLGDRTGKFQPKMMGNYRGTRVELITVFGNRWIPFASEVSGCSAPAKGFGIHGTPYTRQKGELVDDTSSIGFHASDGCIRLSNQDMFELFSVITQQTAYVDIVDNFYAAKLPYPTSN